jgi:hypothetical protein
MPDATNEAAPTTPEICPHCGAPMPPHANPLPSDDREYDHRGVLLPRRTRVGGIVIPQ